MKMSAKETAVLFEKVQEQRYMSPELDHYLAARKEALSEIQSREAGPPLAK